MPRRRSGPPEPCSSTPRTSGPCARSGSPHWSARMATTIPAAVLVLAAVLIPTLGGVPVADDLAEVSARFGAALRRAGLPVGPGRCERFAAAVTLARPQTPRALYLCALATLVSGQDQIPTLEAVFSQVFGGLADVAGRLRPGSAPAAAQPPRTLEDLLAQAASAARRHLAGARQALPADAGSAAAPAAEAGREVTYRYLGSTAERLAAKDFAELSDSELQQLAALMRQITLAVPLRRSRRQRRRPGGPRTDMRATLRQARRTGGHAFYLIGRAPARRPRRLVVL